jgi:hypothetical protein
MDLPPEFVWAVTSQLMCCVRLAHSISGAAHVAPASASDPTGSPADMVAPAATLVPWLCVPSFHRVCPCTAGEVLLCLV